MERMLYLLAKTVIFILGCFPLKLVARLGRIIGFMVYLADARHRKVTFKNLRMCFPEKPDEEIRAIARENFKRIGENLSCVVKTSMMNDHEIQKIMKPSGLEKLPKIKPGEAANSIVFAIGHFGNFELYARFNTYLSQPPPYRFATTYRGLKQESLNRLVQSFREKSGCLFFERRRDVDALKNEMHKGGLMLGFLADQYGGNKGLCVPLMGHESSTTVAPALFALRYHCPLYTGICYRVALGQWRIEIGDEIPTHENGHPRSTEEIMLDVNHAFDAAIRRDPANWFWVHNRWKRDGSWWKKKAVEPSI